MLLDIIEETTEIQIQHVKELLGIVLLRVREGRGNKSTNLLPVLTVPCFKTRIRSTALIDAWNFRTRRDLRSHLRSKCLFI